MLAGRHRAAASPSGVVQAGGRSQGKAGVIGTDVPPSPLPMLARCRRVGRDRARRITAREDLAVVEVSTSYSGGPWPAETPADRPE